MENKVKRCNGDRSTISNKQNVTGNFEPPPPPAISTGHTQHDKGMN